MNEYTVVDVDFHFMEDLDKLRTYYDEPWRTDLEEGGVYSNVSFYPNFTGDNKMAGRIQRDVHPGSMGREEVESGMEKLGVDKTLLLSDMTLTMQGLHTADDRSVVMANGITDYVSDTVLDPEAGVYSAIPVPYHHPDAAVDLIERAKDEEGFVGVYLVTEGPEPPLGHRRYEPIYEAAADAGLPVIFHSAGSSLDGFHRKGFEEVLATHTLWFLESNMEQLTSLLVQGVPEKFPDLDMVFLESGLFWVPALVQRLDTEYMKRQSEATLLEKRPSKYVREHCYFGTQPLEHPDDPSHLEHVFDMVGGPERVMYASDYPHWDFDHPRSVAELSFLSHAERQRVLAGTAEEVFGI